MVKKPGAGYWIMLMVTSAMLSSACSPSDPNELEKLGTIQMTLKGQKFELWIADEPHEQTRGLMFITADQMTPLPDGTERGMIFVFDHEQPLSFWMKNTVIPLDIAYISSDGVVVSIFTMPPLVTRTFPSGKPAQFAIEVNASRYNKIGIQPGDQIDIPATILKRLP